jgi:hypothetical protein
MEGIMNSDKYKTVGIRAFFSTLIALFAFAMLLLIPLRSAAANPPEPKVAIHVSENTAALDASDQWWGSPPSWHYFVMYESLEEALRSDGIPFVEVSDADIAGGNLLNLDGSPKYPIVISLAAEAIDNTEIAPLNAYVAAGGFLFAGSSAFTRNADGSARTDFALAAEMGLHIANSDLIQNWYQNTHFTKLLDSRLVDGIPDGTLIWRMPLNSEEIPLGVSPTHGVHGNHYVFSVNADSSATVVATGDSGPLLTVTPYGKGVFLYHGAAEPLIGHGGYDAATFSYLIYRNAIEWAFASDNVPIVKLSPWRYDYNAAFVVRHDFENSQPDISGIAASALAEYSLGVKGDYYFCTGTLRSEMTGSVQAAAITGLQNAVQFFGATIGSHNGGLINPNNTQALLLDPSNLDYWHWGPDEALDVTTFPTGTDAGTGPYATGQDYAQASIAKSFDDIDGWLAGLDNGRPGCWAAGNCPRVWTAPYFNATREGSYQVLANLGVASMSEQVIGLYPHWVLSTQTTGTHYPTLALPYSNSFINGAMAQAIEDYTDDTLQSTIDFYYGLGGLIQIYGHTLTSDPTDTREATYIQDAMAKDRMWSTNAVGVYDWWKARSAVTVSTLYSVSGNTADAQALISGATDTATAIEMVIPNTSDPNSTGLQVLFDGSPADPADYRIVGNTVKMLVGNTVSTVDVTYALPNPVPVAISLSPAAVAPGGADFQLTVKGTGFTGSSVIRWNGSDLATISVSSSQLTATIPQADIVTAGTATVTVFNPAPGGGTSNALSFIIDGTLPVVTAFAAASPSASLNVPITSFIATDNSGIAGYLITTSSTPPLAGDSGWTTAAPTVWTAGGDGTYTLYPWAKDVAGNVSAVYGAPVTVVVDTTAPTVTGFSATSPSGSVSIPITSLTATDVAGVGVTGYLITESNIQPLAGDTGWSSVAPTVYTVVSEGTYTLYPWTKDGAGNVSTVYGTPQTVVVDTTPPNAPLVTGTTPTNNTSPTWTWTTGGGGGNGTYRYRLDNSDLTTGTTTTTATSYTAPAQADGSHTLYVQERDAAGNWSLSGSFTIVVDTTPPNAPLVSSTTPTNNPSPTWTWTSGGGGGNGTYRYKLDDSNLTTGATTTTGMSYTASTQSEGTHTLYVQERDDVGNWSLSGSFAVVVDTTPPTISISSGPTTTVTNSGPVSYTVTYTGADSVTLASSDITLNATGGAGGTVSVTGSGTSSRTVTISSITGNGTLGISIKPGTASDLAGNMAAGAGPSAMFTVDNIAPITTITSQPSNPTNTTSASFSFSSNEAGSTFECKLDGGNYAVCTSPQLYDSLASNETHTFSVRATDAAGNTDASPPTYSWLIDTSALGVTVSTTALDPTRTSPIPVTVTFSKPVTDFLATDVTFTNGTMTGSSFSGSGTTYTFTVTPSADGLVMVNIAAGVAHDAATNPNGAASLSITYDTTAPNAPSVSGTTPTKNTTPTWNWISGGGGGNGTYRYKLDNSDLTTGATTTTGMSYTPPAQADGSHTLYVQERDAAGNWSLSGSFTIVIDTTAPTIGISAPSSVVGNSGLPVSYTVTYGGADAVTLTAQDVTLNKTGSANGTVTVSGTGAGTRTIMISSITGSGTLGVSIAANTASDAAGNIAGGAGPSTVFTVDNSSGDLNGDGDVTVADALKALRITAGLDAPTAVDMAHGDVAPIVGGVPQPDGKINIGDVVVILRRAVGLMTW